MTIRDENLVRAVVAVHFGLVSLEQARACLEDYPEESVLEALVAAASLGAPEAEQVETVAQDLIQLNHGSPDEALALFGGWEAVYGLFASSADVGPPRSGTVHLDDRQVVTTEQVGRYRKKPDVRPSDPSELGRGAIGRVYVAHDSHTGREVAIKELLPEHREESSALGVTTSALASRFLREARVTAQLEHPNIIPVYEVGRRRDGTLYYSMRVVRGRTLSEAMLDAATMTARLRLLVHFVSLCQTVAYAHSRGVVHRDIKPQNVMVGEFGETVLLDWGVAKVRGQQDVGHGALAQRIRDSWAASALTMVGDLLGTPAYMSPEQAKGAVEHVDERSDVYALGVVLHVLLLGPDRKKQPKRGDRTAASPHIPTPDEKAVESADSCAPTVAEGARPAEAPSEDNLTNRVSELRRRFLSIPLPEDTPQELAAICAKATSESKDQRYADAAQLAEEVQAFLDGRRVGAYEYNAAEVIRRFVRTHRVAVMATALASLAVVVTAVIGYLRVLDERDVARRAEAAERLRVAEAQSEGARAAMQAGDMLEARAKIRGSLEAADALPARVLWWRASLDPSIWSRQVDGNPYQLAFSPSGDSAVVGYASVVVRFDAVTSQPLHVWRGHRDQITAMAVDPRGRFVAAGGWDGSIRVWDYPDGRGRRLKGHASKLIHTLAFHPSESVFASGGDEVGLWDAATGEHLRTLTGHVRGAYALSFHPDGNLLAAATAGKTIRLWKWREGRETRRIDGDGVETRSVSFSPDGTILVAGGTDGVLRVWSTESWELLKKWPGHDGSIYGLSFRPDSQWIASGGFDGRVLVRDAKTGELVRELAEHTGAVRTVVFGPNGKRLLSGGMHGTVRMWNLDTKSAPSPVRGHDGPIKHVDVSSDGRTVATVGGAENSVRLWDRQTGRARKVMLGHSSSVYGVAFSPDDKTVASSGADRTIRLWDVATGKERVRLLGHRATVYGLAFGPLGRVVVSAGTDRVVRVWDAASGRTLRVIPHKAATGVDLALGPKGRMLATAGSDHRVRLWEDYEEGAYRELEGHSGPIWSVEFTPDGESIVSAGEGGEVWQWSVSTGKGRRVGKQPGRAYRLGMHPNGRIVAVPGSDRVLRLWPLDGGDARALRGHVGEVNAAAFTPDGEFVASVGDDETLRMWEVSTGHPHYRAPLLVGRDEPELCSHRGWERIVAGSPPEPLATASEKWRGVVRNEAFVASVCSGSCDQAARTHLCIGTWEGNLELWDVTRDTRLAASKVGEVRQTATVYGGCAALAGDRVVLLDANGRVTSLRESGARAIGMHEARLWLIADELLVDFGDNREPVNSTPVNPGVTAVGRGEAVRAIGYQDGTVAYEGKDAKRPTFFESTPSKAVKLIRFGPRGTVLVGFANGAVGLWNRQTGRRLQHAQLHGPVVHAQIDGSQVVVATSLGDYLTWDLRALRTPYCELIREIWRQVPVVWKQGNAAEAPVPESHPCSPGPTVKEP